MLFYHFIRSIIHNKQTYDMKTIVRKNTPVLSQILDVSFRQLNTFFLMALTRPHLKDPKPRNYSVVGGTFFLSGEK